jgi:hypothetical protein
MELVIDMAWVRFCVTEKNFQFVVTFYALSGGIVLEEAVDLSYDRLLMNE